MVDLTRGRTHRSLRRCGIALALASALALGSHAAAAQVREVDLLRGCWKLSGISSDPFWSVPFRFSMEKTPYAFLAGEKGRSLQPLAGPGDNVGDTVRIHGVWSIGGDSVNVVRSSDLSGTWSTLAMRGDSLVGTGTAFDDMVVPGRTPPRFPVVLRRVACPAFESRDSPGGNPAPPLR